MATYELWEMGSGNLVGSWATEADALAIIRNALDRHGEEVVLTLSLLVEDMSGDTTLVAEGAALAALARQDAPSPDRRSA